MFRAWWRNVVPLAATALVVNVPWIALRLLGPVVQDHLELAYEVLIRAIDAVAWLIGTVALTASGLEALRGRRPRPLRLLLRGFASTWRLFLALLRAFRLTIALGAILAAGWLVVGYWSFDTASGVLVPILMMAVTAVFLVSGCLTAIWVFPLPAVVLENPRDGIRQAVRRTLELTWDRRLRLFAFMTVVLAIAGALNLGETFLRFGGELSLPVANVAIGAMDALGSSLVELAPAAAYLLLAREKYGPSADQLGLIFD